jgi:hypothetical protein
MRSVRVDLKLLLALPGILLGGLGLIGGGLLELGFDVPDTLVLVVAMLGAYFAILAISSLFERLLPSFRDASGLLEGIVGRLGLTPGWALTLGLSSAIGEELFFRWFLLGLGMQYLPVWVAVLAQAVVFAAFHPAPRHAWAYPLWTLLVGVLFGWVTTATGSVLPAMMAHYVFNHSSFNQVLGPAQDNPISRKP